MTTNPKLDHDQVLGKLKLNAMTRLLQVSMVQQLNYLVEETKKGGLYLAGEDDGMGGREFDLADDLSKIKSEMINLSYKLIGAIANWSPAGDGSGL